VLAATGGGRDLADFSNRVWRHLHQCRNLPPDNPQLRAYQRNLPTLIAERARHVLALVSAAQAEGGDEGNPHLARDAWLAARRCFAFLAPGAGKSLSITLAIVLFPHAATPPPGCGVPPTAARHLIVFPFCTNINELLDEGLRLEERPCRECRAAAQQADPACCDACRNELHRAAEASSLCSRLGLRRSHVIELARHVYVLPDRFNPRENLRHRRDFEQAWIVLATQDKVARACEAGHIGPADVRALWADEGDYGNNPDERRGSFSWDIIQRTLWTSWVNLFSGTCAEWMRDLPELARGAPSPRPSPLLSPPHLPPLPRRRSASRTATCSAPSTPASSPSRRSARTGSWWAGAASGTSRSRRRTWA